MPSKKRTDTVKADKERAEARKTKKTWLQYVADHPKL